MPVTRGNMYHNQTCDEVHISAATCSDHNSLISIHTCEYCRTLQTVPFSLSSSDPDTFSMSLPSANREQTYKRSKHESKDCWFKSRFSAANHPSCFKQSEHHKQYAIPKSLKNGCHVSCQSHSHMLKHSHRVKDWQWCHHQHAGFLFVCFCCCFQSSFFLQICFPF